MVALGGATSQFAALNVFIGGVIGRCAARADL